MIIEKCAVNYPKGNGVVRQVARAKEALKMQKEKACRIDLGIGGISGVLTLLACKAMEINPTFGPVLAVILTPIFGKHIFNRYENVDNARNEYKSLKNSTEYQNILTRYKEMKAAQNKKAEPISSKDVYARLKRIQEIRESSKKNIDTQA